MIVMISNQYSFRAGFLAGTYPDRIAHLHTPDSWREPAIRFGLDNGVYGAWSAKREWNEPRWRATIERAVQYLPMWAVVPDWVGDKELTLKKWDIYSPYVKSLGLRCAIAAQNGMTPSDIPKDADVLFIGGTEDWKWNSLKMWTDNFPRVHIGRVNTYKLLMRCHEAGAESCDGTGWFRDPRRILGLERYLNETSEIRTHQPELDL
jgi:hypothetical protein